MLIGVVCAMETEIKSLKKKLTDITSVTISNIEFIKGYLQGRETVIAVSGVGKVNAAVCTQTMILKFSPAVIINIGVAGGLYGKVNIGDVVIAEAVLQHDMDTSAIGDPVGMISGINRIFFPCNRKLTELLSRIDLPENKLVTGIIATGDKFMNNREDTMRVAGKFNAIAFDMESGSIGHVCYVNGIDFCVIRAISDNGDQESHIDYTEFLDASAEQSIRILEKLFREL